MDGAEAFKEGLHYIPYSMQSHILRLNHPLTGDLPRLDNIARLPELTKISYTIPDKLVRAVLTTCFFFELDEAPTRLHSQYHCHGLVLCAQRQARFILKHILVEFPGAKLQTNRGDYLGKVENDNSYSICGYYPKVVEFSMASLDEEMSILFTSSSHQHPIRGFPGTIQ